jgi:7-cyano-7-deazaguanine synthase in queuosine biosynthesis
MTPKTKTSTKEPVELTKEEKEIIAQTKILEKRETLPQKTGVVLTGGIDSTVTLCIAKRTNLMEIQPIVFIEEGREEETNKAIRDILEHEAITSDIKYFEKTNTRAGKKEVLQWCFENNINPLYFGANMEEDQFNNLRLEFLEWKQLASDMNNHGVDVHEPLHTVKKSDIITDAQKYVVLPLTAKPNDSSKFKKIREKAFQDARIDDPHVEIELES